LYFSISLIVFITACQRQSATDVRDANKRADEVTVYASTDRVFSEPILKAYEQKTGVKVNAVYDTEETKSTGLAFILVAE
jgi:iron(III) transport system substrate-binding protein